VPSTSAFNPPLPEIVSRGKLFTVDFASSREFREFGSRTVSTIRGPNET
jgi:hypothetical protein